MASGTKRQQLRKQDLTIPEDRIRVADQSKRDFFHMLDREDRRWHDMLRDAPSDYSVHWIDELADAKLRAYLRQAYIQLREEQDTGHGVSFLRDLLIRRLLWCARIAHRIEGVIEHYAHQDMIAPNATHQWDGKLAKAERYYSHLTEVMTDICLHLHRSAPKVKMPAGTSAGRTDTGTVQIPVDDT
tara:strand:+ start:983 stop:1540 length:558 start_codon:yes stop_codon:yes gene_type:complete